MMNYWFIISLLIGVMNNIVMSMHREGNCNNGQAVVMVRNDMSNKAIYTATLSQAMSTHDIDMFARTVRKIDKISHKEEILNYQDEDGNSFAHLALSPVFSAQESTALLSFLKANGFPLEKQNNKGQTPLHLTVKKTKYDAAAFLMCSSTCNVLNIKNNKGKTPLMLASESNNQEMFFCFKEGENSRPEEILDSMALVAVLKDRNKCNEIELPIISSSSLTDKDEEKTLEDFSVRELQVRNTLNKVEFPGGQAQEDFKTLMEQLKVENSTVGYWRGIRATINNIIYPLDRVELRALSNWARAERKERDSILYKKTYTYKYTISPLLQRLRTLERTNNQNLEREASQQHKRKSSNANANVNNNKRPRISKCDSL